MGAKNSFEDAVRSTLLGFLPFDADHLYIEEDNGPEATTPYCTISTPFFERIGRTVVSTGVSGGSPTVKGSLRIKTNYEATARFSFVGDGGDNAFTLIDQLSNPLLLLAFRANSLSFMRNSIVRKIPKLRETRWYDAYVIDVVFAFCLETTQQIDSVDSVKTTGTFQSATTTITKQTNVP